MCPRACALLGYKHLWVHLQHSPAHPNSCPWPHVDIAPSRPPGQFCVSLSRPPVGTGHPSSQRLLPPHPVPPWMSLKGAAAVLGSLGPTRPFTSSCVPSAGFLPPPSERNPMYPQEHEDTQGFPGCCALGHRFLMCVTPMPSLCRCGALHRVHLLLPPWANVTQSTTGLSVDPVLHQHPRLQKQRQPMYFQAPRRLRTGTGQTCVNGGTSLAWHLWLPL